MQAHPPVPLSHTLINEVIDRPPATVPSPPLVALLQNDKSRQALRPSDPSLLEAYAQAVSHTQLYSAPASTQAANKTGMRLWTEFTGIFNTAVLRDDLPSPGDSLDTFSARERFLKGETKSIVRYLQTECGLVHGFEALALVDAKDSHGKWFVACWRRYREATSSLEATLPSWITPGFTTISEPASRCRLQEGFEEQKSAFPRATPSAQCICPERPCSLLSTSK